MRNSNRIARAAALLALLSVGCSTTPSGEHGESRKEFVREQWYSWMAGMAEHAAQLPTFEAALTFVEGSMSQEIAARVTEDARRNWPDIQEEEVWQHWLEREPERWHVASYGNATFLLGAKDALEGGPQAEAEPEEWTTERDAQRAELKQKMERFLEQQHMSQCETFWLNLPHAVRSDWLLAWYVESSGEFEGRSRADLQDCPTCAGRGFREVLYSGSARAVGTDGLRREMCETCQGVAVVRRVSFQ